MTLIGSSPSRAHARFLGVNVHVWGSALMQRHRGAKPLALRLGPLACRVGQSGSSFLDAVMTLLRNGLQNAENWGPTENRTNGDIRISMRFFSRVHNTL